MNPTDDRREKQPLPITAEVGGEGGSYADRTMQAETFAGGAGVPRVDGRGGASSVANYAIRQDYSPAGADTDVDRAGAVRYPTEPPPVRAETLQRNPLANLNWRAGLIGAAAGAGAAMVVGLLRMRGRR
jgi:hypothetical protein